MEEARQQTVIIEGQKKIALTGVESVDGFTAQQISLTLISGRAHIAGDELKIAGFPSRTEVLPPRARSRASASGQSAENFGKSFWAGSELCRRLHRLRRLRRRVGAFLRAAASHRQGLPPRPAGRF